MAKAHPVSGTTWYIPEGHVVPHDVPDGVALVGPGAPAPKPLEAVLPVGYFASPDAPEDQPSDDPEGGQQPSQPDTTSSTSTASKPRKSASSGRGARRAAPTTEPHSNP